MKIQKSKRIVIGVIFIITIFLFFGFYSKKECKTSEVVNPENTSGELL